MGLQESRLYRGELTLIIITHEVPGDFERARVGLGGIGGTPSEGGEETTAPLVGRDGMGGGLSSSML